MKIIVTLIIVLLITIFVVIKLNTSENFATRYQDWVLADAWQRPWRRCHGPMYMDDDWSYPKHHRSYGGCHDRYRGHRGNYYTHNRMTFM